MSFPEISVFCGTAPNMVNELMKDLFSWVKSSEGTIHPLIVSAVFITNLCLYILLQTEMEEWPDYGIR